MLLHDLVVGLMRRWYLCFAGAILTAAAGYLVAGIAPATYSATGSMVLIPPRDIVVTGDNPYLYLGGLDQALGVLQVKMNAPETAKPLEDVYSHAQFEVTKDYTIAGPIMQISVTANSAANTLALLQDVMSEAPESLADMQEQLQVPQGSRISIMTLAADDSATINHKKQIRALVVVLGGGGVGTAFLVGAIDRWLLARRSRHRIGVAGGSLGGSVEDGDREREGGALSRPAEHHGLHKDLERDSTKSRLAPEVDPTGRTEIASSPSPRHRAAPTANMR